MRGVLIKEALLATAVLAALAVELVALARGQPAVPRVGALAALLAAAAGACLVVARVCALPFAVTALMLVLWGMAYVGASRAGPVLARRALQRPAAPERRS